MEAERLKQIEEIYHAVLEIAPAERESFFRKHCGADEELRLEVESLLLFETAPDSFLDMPPESLAAEMFAEKERQIDFPGKEIGHYKIIKLLGKGGMGEVYLATDTHLNRQVALKFLPIELTGDAVRLKRFEREAQTASGLNHPNILTIHQFGTNHDSRFIVTEFVTGITLSEKMAGGRLNLSEMLDVAVQIAAALAAHEARIVHRDIKPDNIMIRADGLVKVLDFGLAKLQVRNEEGVTLIQSPPNKPHSARRIPQLTSPGVVMGTANYMSPEQVRGLDVDARTDIFSFGVMLYEMLTGQKPFTGETVNHTIVNILEKEFTPVTAFVKSCPAELDRIIQKTLAKKPDERYRAAKDLLANLKLVQKRLEFENESNISATDNSTNDALATPTAIISPIEMTNPDVSRPQHFLSNFQRKQVFLIAFIIFALTAGGIVSYRYSPSNKQIKSIAVLPFVNESGDANNEYLSDGLSDGLINKLSQLPQIKVVARNSSFKCKGKEIDVRKIADALGVQAIVTGRVTKRGDNLQISVEMIDAAENTQIWGEQYDRRVSDVLAVQKDIVQTVSEKLVLKLNGAQQKQIAKQVTDNSQAYELYLNGVFYRRRNGADNLKKAIEYQNQAIALDPNFAMAYAETALNYSVLIEIGVINPIDGKPKAQAAAAEKAVALDETLP